MSNYHMLAVFDEETARPPTGLELLYHEHRKPTYFDDLKKEELERKCSETLEASYSHYSPKARRMLSLGNGNGFTFESGPFCHEASREGVHALLAGEVSAWPGIDMVSSAHNAYVRGDQKEALDDATWLLDFYDTFRHEDTTDITASVLSSLTKVQGQFAFVMYDEHRRRVLAARDPGGVQPLYWGCTEDGRFMFGSDPQDLQSCMPSATAFPAGTLYASEGNTMAMSPGDKGWVIPGEQWPGRLFSFVPRAMPTPHHPWRFVKAIPRINSRGCVCGAVYRVESEQNLAAVY